MARTRKRKVAKNNPKKSIKAKIRTQKPKAIKNPQSEQLLRCREWIKAQNRLQQGGKKRGSNKAIEIAGTVESPNEISENFEKIPSSADSLAILKTFRKKKQQQSIYYACEWKNCGLECEDDNELFDHVSCHITNLKPINDYYHCLWDLCHFNTQCNREITRHIYYHSYHTKLKTIGESIAQCANIPRCTNDSKNRNNVPDLKTDFVCHWNNCKRSFLSMILFCRHVENHCISTYQMIKASKIRNYKIPCKWENCKSKFPVKYRLVEHMRKHTTEKIVGCFHCGAIFKTNTIFLDHCKRQPTNNTQEYQCAQCLKYFSTERLLRYHILKHVNCFKCSMCDMSCNSSSGLATHIRYRHLTDRPFHCTQCEKKFVSKADFDQHVATVHKKKVFECSEPECNFVGKSLFFLKRHDYEVHGNNKIIYACHCCDNTYECGSKLSKHLINFHRFQLPSGHRRFIYRMDENGFYRLQTTRIESLEVTRQILSPRASKNDDYLEDSCSEISELRTNETMNVSTYKVIAVQDSSSTDQFIFEYNELS